MDKHGRVWVATHDDDVYTDRFDADSEEYVSRFVVPKNNRYWNGHGDKMYTEDAVFTRPIYAYIHGDITLSAKPFSCPWDSGQIGFQVITRTAADNVGIDSTNKVALLELADAELERENCILSGDVYTVTLGDGEYVVTVLGRNQAALEKQLSACYSNKETVRLILDAINNIN